jgi:hypothetical protein
MVLMFDGRRARAVARVASNRSSCETVCIMGGTDGGIMRGLRRASEALLLVASGMMCTPAAWGQTEKLSEAVSPGSSAAAGFTVTVGKDGLVKDCTVTESSGDGSIDAVICPIIMKRARFTPARDRRGRPIESKYSKRMRFLIPPENTETKTEPAGLPLEQR